MEQQLKKIFLFTWIIVGVGAIYAGFYLYQNKDAIIADIKSSLTLKNLI